MKNEKTKISKEQKLKITAALLVALSGILAGIVELFSDCCCVKTVDCDLCPVRIVLLVVNVVAVLIALIADIIGIIEYGKHNEETHDYDVICADCPHNEPLGDIDEFLDKFSDKSSMLKLTTEEPAQTETSKQNEKKTPRKNKKFDVFILSLVTTAISFILLCASVIVLAII